MPKNRIFEEQLRQMQEAREAIQRQLDELDAMMRKTQALLDKREPERSPS